MSIVILRAAAALYAVSAVLYVGFLVRPRHARLAAAGLVFLAAAFVVHTIGIGAGCREFGGREFFALRGGVVLAVCLAAGAFLVVDRLYRVPSLGAFLVPLLVLALSPAALVDPAHPEVPPDFVRHTAFHVLAAILAVALFAVAFGVALMYLLQDREVKGKRFGALFSRLPSLGALERLNQRLVRAGFVVYTVALLAGTLRAAAEWRGAWSWDPQVIASVAVWLLYGALVQLGHKGWHGRRFAVLTLVGFVCLAGTMGALRAFPGFTRHAGDYGVAAEAGGAQ